MSLHKCAYWVSLRGAAKSKNETAQTIYLPKTQQFNVTGLKSLMNELAHNRIPTYKGRN